MQAPQCPVKYRAGICQLVVLLLGKKIKLKKFLQKMYLAANNLILVIYFSNLNQGQEIQEIVI